MTDIFCTSELKVEYIDHMGHDERILEAMMVSTKAEWSEEFVSELADTGKSGRINFLMANRHGTPFEHATIQVRTSAPIAVYREWHRHRIGFSYNEESGRYRQLEPKFYIPPPERPLVQEGSPGAYTFVPGSGEMYMDLSDSMTNHFYKTYQLYEAFLEAGVAKEVARGVLPVYIFSTQFVTLNPRSCMAFLSLRTRDPEKANLSSLPVETPDGAIADLPRGTATFPSFPMWEIERCALQLETIFADLFPITYSAFCANGRVSP